MKPDSILRPGLATVGFCILHFAFCFRVSAQGTAFTYQGHLNSSGGAANGLYDFRFRLAGDSLGNNYVGSPFLTNSVPVTSGLFIATVNFGASLFTGSNYWLEVDVKTNGAGSYTALSPLQALTPTPYAIMANSASNLLGSVPAAQLSGAIPSAQLAGTYSSAVTLNNAGNSFSGNGAGVTGVNAATLNGLNASSFWQLGGNNVSAGQFLGSTNNQAVELKVNGGRALRLEPNTNNAPNVIGGSLVNFVTTGRIGATIAGGGSSYRDNLFTNRVTADFGTVGGGFDNTASGIGAVVGGGGFNTASNLHATVGGGALNIARGSDTTVGGGINNTASGDYATVGGGYNNTASDANATVGGGRGNSASYDSATVGGGANNIASSNSATVGGGAINVASSDYATVGGGYNNTAGNLYATVGGGSRNSASRAFATVGGGANNTAIGSYATTGGGFNSIADGYAATVAGGYQNRAQGDYSFAAGQNAQAINNGTFVWNSFLLPNSSPQPRTFTIFGAHGLDVEYYTQDGNGAGTRYVYMGDLFGGNTIYTWSGAHLTDGGIWSNSSDKNRKTDFADIDARTVLEKLAALPVRIWRYTNESSDIKHLGPTAQDFMTAFGLGTDDKSIGTLDESGVALAAIKGLNQKLEEQRNENAGLKARLEALEKKLSGLAEKH